MTRTAHSPDAPTQGLVELADRVFETYSPYEGDGFRNHCRRLFHLTNLLLDADGVTLDRNVAYAIAMTHDLGIVSQRDAGETFLARSLALFERETQGHDLGGTDLGIVRECMLYNHRLRPVPNLGRAAEAFRRAVWIEHSRGHRRYGLDRAPVRAIFERYPRENFDRVLLDFLWRTVRAEPSSIVHGIFL